MKKAVSELKTITVCDLCGESLGEAQWQQDFQYIKPLRNERPLKQKWYHVLRFWLDGNPTYDVHHTCLYELLRAYQEGKIGEYPSLPIDKNMLCPATKWCSQ